MKDIRFFFRSPFHIAALISIKRPKRQSRLLPQSQESVVCAMHTAAVGHCLNVEYSLRPSHCMLYNCIKCYHCVYILFYLLYVLLPNVQWRTRSPSQEIVGCLPRRILTLAFLFSQHVTLFVLSFFRYAHTRCSFFRYFDTRHNMAIPHFWSFVPSIHNSEMRTCGRHEQASNQDTRSLVLVHN